ncbi:protein-L-isoaspartate O-methyltransferase family protein [Hydrogenispora ethanolica]|nr:methyltransferase domain-containing protein [Hydrogenispora ethanolica]
MANYHKYQNELLEVARRVPYRQFPLREATERAFLACPRHRFVQRYRLGPGAWVEITPENLAEHLPLLYRDVPLALQEDRNGRVLSTISQPSFVLYMLDLLRLEQGQRVFEVGAGSGWNAALMGYLVGETGHVYSAEILPEAAQQAQSNLRQLQVRNVTIIAGDGGPGLEREAPFDRVIFTAGGFDLPRSLYRQVKDDGLVLFPLKVKGAGDILYLLKKAADHFTALQAIDSQFVPLTGKHRAPETEGVFLEELPEWESLKTRFVSDSPLPWEADIRLGASVMSKTLALRFFLSLREPDFFILKLGSDADEANAFGLRAGDSLAICRDGRVVAYGNDAARERLFQAVREWVERGRPAPAEFRLQIYPADSVLPCPAGADQWLVKRAESQFLWTL